jgi:hypothetical protein
MTRLILFLLFVYAPTIHSTALSKTSVMMIECEAVYLWAGQLWARDKANAEAKKLLKAGSAITVANFMLNEKNGIVTKETLALFKPITRRTKSRLDAISELSLIRAEIQRCNQSTKNTVEKLRAIKKPLWGKTFSELEDTIYKQALTTLKL